MSVYLIAFVDVKDEQRFKDEYIPPTVASIEQYGGKLLATNSEPEVKEGDWPTGRTVICEFPDQELIDAWYHSEEYASSLKLRKEIADSSLAFISGV